MYLQLLKEDNYCICFPILMLSDTGESIIFWKVLRFCQFFLLSKASVKMRFGCGIFVEFHTDRGKS
jgi:hypothetical protein